MAINSPPSGKHRSCIADWIEILSLTKSRRTAGRADCIQLYKRLDSHSHRVEKDPENDEEYETEILEEDQAEFADMVYDELEYRADVLEELYPFEIRGKGSSWQLLPADNKHNKQTKASRSSYVFCLLTSAVRDQTIHCCVPDSLIQAIPSLFQMLSTNAAAGILGGNAVSFGWPRPDGSSFLHALQALSRRLAVGKALNSIPGWSTGHAKDAGIDVVAWRDFADKQPGKLILFGQVASGSNWTEKSVKQALLGFFNWFSQKPAEHFLPAIFIPFPQHHDCAARRELSFEEVAVEEAWIREQKYGIVIDRLRIAAATAECAAPMDDPRESRDLARIRYWIFSALEALRTTP